MLTLAITHSKRIIAGSLWILFWLGIQTAQSMPVAADGWASLVPLRCPLSWLWDIQCPTCGLGRSLVAAALGHAQESWHYHPFGLPLFWGAQAAWLGWIIWPNAWKTWRMRFSSIIQRHPLLIWFLISAYVIWGFCWRAKL